MFVCVHWGEKEKVGESNRDKSFNFLAAGEIKRQDSFHRQYRQPSAAMTDSVAIPGQHNTVPQESATQLTSPNLQWAFQDPESETTVVPTCR